MENDIDNEQKVDEAAEEDGDAQESRLRYLELAVAVLLDSYKASMAEFKEHRTAIEYLLSGKPRHEPQGTIH